MNEISVIIPVYNREKQIQRAIKSVKNQTLPPDEIIVVDDGSTDNTCETIKMNFPDVKLIQIPHSGVSSARNHGIKNACFEYTAFLDSDDEWKPDKLEKQINYMVNNPDILISHTDELWIRNNKKVNKPDKYKKYQGRVFDKCLNVTMIGVSTVMIKRNLFFEIGFFDEQMPVCEDYDLWLRITNKHKIGYLNEKLTVKYGGAQDQLSTTVPYQDNWRFYALEKIINIGKLTKTQESLVKKQIKEYSDRIISGLKKKRKISEINSLVERLIKLGLKME